LRNGLTLPTGCIKYENRVHVFAFRVKHDANLLLFGTESITV
jgi:hypothetical protein